jgi:O-antigen/teichoic acid export membrane protein
MKKDNSPLNKSLKLLVKTSFIVFIGLVVSKILGYAYRIIIARYYGPEAYGLFTLALTITSFFASIVALGLTDGLLRYIPMLRAKSKFDELRYLTLKVLKIYVILGIISSVALILASDIIATGIFHNPELSVLIKVIGSVIVFSLLGNVLLTVIRSFEEIGWYSFVYNILQNVAKVVLLVSLVMLGIKSGSLVASLSYALGTVLTFVAAYFVCRYKTKTIFGKYKAKDYSSLSRDFFSYSWPVLFYSIVSIVFYWIDTFSLGYYKSALEVGLYNAAVPIAMLLGLVPELFMQLFFPMISKEYSRENYELIKQLSKQVTKWIFIVILPLFLLLFLFPGAALNIIFGSQYLAAEGALRLLLVGSFISALFVSSTQLISMIGKSKLILMNIIIASVSNFVFNSILVPMPSIFGFDNANGLLGAALATLVSLILFNLLFVIETKKYLSFIPLRRKMVTIGLISLVPLAVLLYLRDRVEISIISIVLLSGIFFIIYFGLIIALRAFDKNDLMIVNAVFRKIFKIIN